MLSFKKHPQNYRLELFDILTTKFNIHELQTLCFAIPVNYDLLSGGDLGSKARELILLLMRQGRLQELINTGKSLRSDITWPSIPSAKTQKRDWKKIEKEFAKNNTTPVEVKVSPGGGSSIAFKFVKAIVTMLVFAVLFQIFAGPIFESVTCSPMSPINCVSLENWWVIGAILGFLTGIGLLDSSGKK